MEEELEARSDSSLSGNLPACLPVVLHACVCVCLSGGVKSSATTVSMRTFLEAVAFNGIRTH